MLALLGIVFLVHPKFNRHPYKLIGLTCLAESHILIYADSSIQVLPCAFDLATYWAVITRPLTFLVG